MKRGKSMVYCPCSLVGFQSNIPSVGWYQIACIFQIWSAPVGYEDLIYPVDLSQSETTKYLNE